MAKLVVLSAGSMTGRTCELNVDRTTIGRVDDNTFPIAEPSVSSHHCEVFLRGSDILIKDLDSTNGTFINGQKITESVLKPGQVLKLGQIELRLDADGMPAPAPSPGGASAPPTTSTSPSKRGDQTLVVPRGVSLTDLEQGPRTSGFDTTSKAFSKKTNKANRLFWIVGAIVFVVIAVALVVLITNVKK
jgi:FHA domain